MQVHIIDWKYYKSSGCLKPQFSGTCLYVLLLNNGKSAKWIIYISCGILNYGLIPCLLIIYDNFSANLPSTSTKGTDLWSLLWFSLNFHWISNPKALILWVSLWLVCHLTTHEFCFLFLKGWLTINLHCLWFSLLLLLAANLRVTHDNCFYGDFIKKIYTI